MVRKMVAIDVAYSEDLGEHVKLWFFLDRVVGMWKTVPDPDEEEETEEVEEDEEKDSLPVLLTLNFPNEPDKESEDYRISEASADLICRLISEGT